MLRQNEDVNSLNNLANNSLGNLERYDAGGYAFFIFIQPPTFVTFQLLYIIDNSQETRTVAAIAFQKLSRRVTNLSLMLRYSQGILPKIFEIYARAPEVSNNDPSVANVCKKCDRPIKH